MKQKIIRKFYLNEETNEVYKQTNDDCILIKISPWGKGEDRRLYKSNPIFNKLKQISFNKAMNLVNKLFEDYSTEWEYEGNTYYIKKSSEFDATFYRNECKQSKHIFQEQSSFDTNVIFQYTFYIVWFRGKIYWMLLTGQYYPQIQLYKFKDINTMPKFSDFAQWTNIKNCKVIFKK